jgi:hypothetical protein
MAKCKLTEEEKKEKKRIASKKYREENKDKIIEWRKNNKEKLLLDGKEYYQNNKEKRIDQAKQYYVENKDKIINTKRIYAKNKYHTDTSYKLMKLIRRRTRLAIQKFGLHKTKSTMEYLGCDHKTFIEWLQWSGETYDPNFNIHNYDSSLYHIDHIKTFVDAEKGIYTFEEVAHYTNLQILPADVNISKGGNSW